MTKKPQCMSYNIMFYYSKANELRNFVKITVKVTMLWTSPTLSGPKNCLWNWGLQDGLSRFARSWNSHSVHFSHYIIINRTRYWINKPVCWSNHWTDVLAEQRKEPLCVLRVKLLEQGDSSCNERCSVEWFCRLLTYQLTCTTATSINHPHTCL